MLQSHPDYKRKGDPNVAGKIFLQGTGIWNDINRLCVNAMGTTYVHCAPSCLNLRSSSPQHPQSVHAPRLLHLLKQRVKRSCARLPVLKLGMGTDVVGFGPNLLRVCNHALDCSAPPRVTWRIAWWQARVQLGQIVCVYVCVCVCACVCVCVCVCVWEEGGRDLRTLGLASATRLCRDRLAAQFSRSSRENQRGLPEY